MQLVIDYIVNNQHRSRNSPYCNIYIFNVDMGTLGKRKQKN